MRLNRPAVLVCLWFSAPERRAPCARLSPIHVGSSGQPQELNSRSGSIAKGAPAAAPALSFTTNQVVVCVGANMDEWQDPLDFSDEMLDFAADHGYFPNTVVHL